MLQLQMMPEDPEAYEIVTSFINERLISMMEEIMLDEVAWNMATNGELEDEDLEKDFEEMVDVHALMKDREFAENVVMEYLPDNYPVGRANKTFFGLYALLNAEEEYVPELPMEYILYSIIYAEVAKTEMIRQDTEDGMFDDLFEDPMFEGMEDEEITTVIRIPEPERTVVKKALYKEYEGEYEGEELDEVVESVLNTFEDLNEYDNVCFQDTDFAILDTMSEEEIAESPLNEQMGIVEQRKPKIIQFPVIDLSGKKGNNAEAKPVRPGDGED